MKITGPEQADITYGLNADQSQANGAKLPWTKKMGSGGAFTIATVSTQNSGCGEISCAACAGKYYSCGSRNDVG